MATLTNPPGRADPTREMMETRTGLEKRRRTGHTPSRLIEAAGSVKRSTRSQARRTAGQRRREGHTHPEQAECPARDVGPRPVLDAQSATPPGHEDREDRHPERLLAHRSRPGRRPPLAARASQDVMGPDGGSRRSSGARQAPHPRSTMFARARTARPRQAPRQCEGPRQQMVGRPLDSASFFKDSEAVRDRRPDEEGIHQREIETMIRRTSGEGRFDAIGGRIPRGRPGMGANPARSCSTSVGDALLFGSPPRPG